MKLAFRKFKVYAKLVVIIAAALVTLLVVYNNHDQRASVWFFGEYQNINVLWLMACTAAAAILVYWILRITRGVLHDMRAAQQEEQLRAREAAAAQRARELEERERRLDDKLKRAIGDQP
ncbi:MAG TPA: hypothetical protein VGM03_14715 [Phycisphaerae bacterium]|jgi:type VI protein secretion system component VasK